jgi:signal transduction histidine kinase
MLPFDIAVLRNQQASLHHQGRLYWAHWLIIALSALITLTAWTISHSALQEQDQLRFDREVDRVIGLMQERIRHYEDALLSGVAVMQSHGGEMSRRQWYRYSQYLDLNQRYPGINGIGVIHYVDTPDYPAFLERVRREAPDFHIHPQHGQDVSLPITYIEPESTNAAAVGLDVAFEINRRTAALKSRITGTTQISGPIILVQDKDRTPGFLFYAPYYAHQDLPAEHWDVSSRESLFKGLIYAPLVVRDLVKGTLSAESRSVSLSIRDADKLIYTEAASVASPEPAFTETVKVPMHGRTWEFEIASVPSFINNATIDQPSVVLLSGIGLDLMLIILFWTMSHSNRQVLSMAEEMTENLSRQALQLSENNRDLESFAHIVSHDLKTPIRNIYSLTEMLEDDLSDFMASNDSHADIQSHLKGLREQAARSQSLISGILEYSILNADETSSTSVDNRALILSIGTQLNLNPAQLKLSGTFPVLHTNSTRLEQVLTNLIDNAVKYNPDRENATVELSVTKHEGVYQFAVTDTGPGIEQRFHERIFKPFTTLEAITDINSSGIGLSIVQRAVERQGGQVQLTSQPGSGSTFRFTWPEAGLRHIEVPIERHA